MVSAVYATVAYRLINDLGIRTETHYLEQEGKAFLHELEHANTSELNHLREHLPLTFGTKNSRYHVHIRHPELEDFVLSDSVSEAQADGLMSLIPPLPDGEELSSGHFKFEGQSFIWFYGKEHGVDLILAVKPNSLEASMSYAFKRLAITSAIVFWIAVWLALLLSSWITKRVKDKNDTLKKLATHDSLTGLPNRLYLVNKLHGVMQTKEQEAPESGCLLAIDVDHLKDVNDSLGHSAGDKLLIVLAYRIQQELSEDQMLVRAGGDEFLVWAPNMSIDGASVLASHIITACNEPLMMDQLTVNIGASLGVAHFPSHTDHVETLITYADSAMYQAKQRRAGWATYCPNNSGNVDNKRHLQLRSELNSALSENQIQLYYQPKVKIETGEIVGAEALARWIHPTDGMISPMIFIPLVEQSGLVQEFGRYVIRQAIQQLVTWRNQRIESPIAVNLSPYNLLDKDLVLYTQNLLVKGNISPELLEIELTETATSVDIQTISNALNDFKEIGVKLSIDDFGTGMSSLAYVSSLNVDTIKVDRSFVHDIETNANHYSIVNTALTLARSFGCTIVVEGIENKTQMALLKEMGCDFGQGFYYSRPLPVDKFTAMIKFTRTLPVA